MKNTTLDDARELAKGLTDKIEQVRRDTADSFESAADSVRATAEHGCDAIGNLAQGAAKRLDSTAKIVRKYDLSRSMRNMVRENPGIAVGVGVAVGLFAGLSMRRH
jgi:ElaB/YqjD/DUF883 family membrane-anchored ribosome-binding protein